MEDKTVEWLIESTKKPPRTEEQQIENIMSLFPEWSGFRDQLIEIIKKHHQTDGRK